MELINKIGGFGIIQATAKEAALMGRMRELAGNQNKYTLGWDNPQTQEFSVMVNDLFPAFYLDKPNNYSSGYQVRVWKHGPNRHFNLPAGHLISVKSRFPPYHAMNKRSSNEAELGIVFPENNPNLQFSMTVALDHCYQPDCIDDLVELLGQREKPILSPAAKLSSEYNHIRYGIAEVPQLGKVLQLYERTAEMIKNAKETIEVTPKELNFLRRDSLEHENLAVRDMSKERYQKELQRLVNY